MPTPPDRHRDELRRDEPSDAERIQRIRLGDRDAFERLFVEHHAALCAFVVWYVESPETAADLVQELFAALWLRRDRWQVRTTVRAYLYTAARNQALHWLRHEAVGRRWAATAVHDDVPAGASQPVLPADVALERAEALAALRAAITRLPERSRLALTLRWERQMSYAEVAEVMGISVKGVEKLLSVALRSLRRLLGDSD